MSSTEPALVERRIKPHFEELAEQTRRDEQTRIFRRNEAIGLVLVAASILGWWLWHTNSAWIFPVGWWRL
jgi:hypothetical protein